MPAISNLVVLDGQGVPVSHTLVPAGVIPKVTWREDLAAIPVEGQVNCSLDLANKSSLYKLRLTLDLPVMEESTGATQSGYTAAPKIAHIVRADCTFFASTRSTSDQRNDLMELVMNAMADSLVRDSFKQLNKPY